MAILLALSATTVALAAEHGGASGVGNAFPTVTVAKANTTCGAQSPVSPASILIPLAQPSGSLGKHATSAILGANVEFRALNASPLELLRTSVRLPSIYATFYPQSGSRLQLQYLPQNASLPLTGWSSPLSASQSINPSTTFSTSPATLSSGWHAVMVNASYGSFQLEFRWQWWVKTGGHQAGTQFSPWSRSVTANTTHEQPSTFYPAPWVGVHSTSGSKVPPGSTYAVDLVGNVSGTAFRVVLETSSGHELNTACATSPVGSATYNATIPLTYANGTAVPAGPYIVHIHNAGTAIVVFANLAVT